MSAPPPTETLIAERYQLKRRLAQGGMAEVWLAVDLTLDRKVAVKWLKPALASDEVVAERFRREAIAAASLNHPNIVAVHDVFEHEGRQAVVMQLVDGKSLRQLLDTQKRLSPELTGHIGACTAAALQHAHENNFVHRDVKPGNIMITPDGRVLLTDFGIAKALAGGDDLTSDNIMMGTAKYLSPEQVRGKKLDGRADLYSLGLVLYECLAGRVPFLGETDADTALARLQRDPTDLALLRATLPTGLVTIIHQLLARNPSHRPATGADLVTALEAASVEEPPTIDDTPPDNTPGGFTVGRLRRAPSDTDNNDRRRPSREVPATAPQRAAGRVRRSGATPVVDHRGATTSPTTPEAGAPRRIPGEPPRITGSVPVLEPKPASAVPRDPTPDAGPGQRGKPARGMQQGAKPSLAILGGLLLLAALVAVALWLSLLGGDDSGEGAPTSQLPASATTPDEVDSSESIPTNQVTTPSQVEIAAISAYDPEGDNGDENNDLAELALADADADTTWRTECYGSEYMGGKRGVGLVVSLNTPSTPAISADVVNGPYIVEFYTSTADAIPATFDDWDNQLGQRLFDAEGAVVVSEVPPAPVQHYLILLMQIGRDTSCTDANPYRGRLGEVTLVQ